MIQKEWPVLIVDDEPDVLEVTRLVLKDLRVDDVPLKLYTAASKAEAIQLLTQSAGPPAAPFIAVALIDVVMETDQAGLELCEFIRTNLKNKTTQLYVRTGQAGLAPERTVVDRYDINGYFTKVEATEDKLYSLIKAGVRQHELLTNTLVLMQMLSQASGKSTAGIRDTVSHFGTFLQRNQVGVSIVVDGAILVAIGQDPSEVLDQCRRLDQLDGVALSPQGDRFVADGRTVMFEKPAGPTTAAANLLFTNVSMPSPGLQLLFASFLTVLAGLARAGATIAEPVGSA